MRVYSYSNLNAFLSDIVETGKLDLDVWVAYQTRKERCKSFIQINEPTLWGSWVAILISYSISPGFRGKNHSFYSATKPDNQAFRLLLFKKIISSANCHFHQPWWPPKELCAQLNEAALSSQGTAVTKVTRRDSLPLTREKAEQNGTGTVPSFIQLFSSRRGAMSLRIYLTIQRVCSHTSLKLTSL